MSHNNGYHSTHCHSHYSALDGLSTVPEIVEAAARDGHRAVSLTDHGNMSGFSELHKEATKEGLLAIPSIEMYQRPPPGMGKGENESLGDDTDASTGKHYYHLIVGAWNNVGYSNLVKLTSASNDPDHFKRKPLIDFDLLSQFSEGLYITTACLGGIVQRTLLDQDDYSQALQYCSDFVDIVGKEHFFVELARHGIPDQEKVMPDLIKMANDLDVKVIAANDSHYTSCDSQPAHDAFICVQTQQKVHGDRSFQFHGAEHFFKTEQEMLQTFSEIPEAVTNCAAIAELAQDLDLDNVVAHEPKIPTFKGLPPEFDHDTAYLRHLAEEALPEKYDSVTQEIRDRVDYEIDIISSMGFSGYFLIVSDYCRWAIDQGILVGPGRGSGAGSIIAYLLGIVFIDPIKYDLMFERFLNPDRVSLPDFDVDFPTERRAEVIQYIIDTYGADNVVAVATTSTIQSKNALRDAARVMGLDFAMSQQLTEALPPALHGTPIPLTDLYDKESANYESGAEFRKLVNSCDVEVKEVVDIALQFYGKIRGSSVHACAVLIGDDPITDVIPTMSMTPPKKSNVRRICTQWNEKATDRAGLVKFDLLGLRNLDVIGDTLDAIEASGKERPDLYSIPDDDPATFELLCVGRTAGVFQMESSGMTALIKEIAPTCIEDISTTVALYRPGPLGAGVHEDFVNARKTGVMPPLFHPEAAEVLASTQGLMIYQEGIMKVAQHFAGFSLAEADNLRRIVGKKLREEMPKLRKSFVKGVVDKGYDQELGEKIFTSIEPAADYSFNLSHSLAYAYIAYWTAYFKANYPVEYMGALLASVQDSPDKKAMYLSECKQMGLTVTAPSVNRSKVDYSSADGRISIGLEAIEDVGAKAAGYIVDRREKGEKYADLSDFVKRVPKTVLNRKVMTGLVKAGAFDDFGHSRLGLLEILDDMLVSERKRRTKSGGGQQSLADMSGDFANIFKIDVPEIEDDPLRIMAFEYEVLGSYITVSPIDGKEHLLQKRRTHTIPALIEEAAVKGTVIATISGAMRVVKAITTKKGDRMARIAINDETGGLLEAVVFPRQYAKYKEHMGTNKLIWVKGEYKGEQFIATSLGTIGGASYRRKIDPLRITIKGGVMDELLYSQIISYLEGTKGHTNSQRDVELVIDGEIIDLGLRTSVTSTLLMDLKILLGQNSVDTRMDM